MKKPGKRKPYYQSYDLLKDPFPVESFDNTLILTPELTNRLDRIKSLIAFSEKLVVVTAVYGGGKSILADYLESIPEKNWKVCLVQADLKMDRELLSFEIVQQFTPDKADVPGKSIPQLHKYLEFASKNEIIPVIILDDADKLSLATLEFILELAALQYGETRFRFILFGDESITDKLEHERLADLTLALVYKVNLPILSMEQLKEYLNNRLSSTGEINRFPFTEEDIKHIYLKTGGLPRSINYLAREIMESKIARGFALSRRTQIIAIAAVIFIVVTGLYYNLLQGPEEISDDEIIARYQTLAQAPPAPLASNTEEVEPEPVEVSQADTPTAEGIDPLVEETVVPADTAVDMSMADDSFSSPQEPEVQMDTSAVSTEEIEVITETIAEVVEPLPSSGIIDEPGTIASNLAMADQTFEAIPSQVVIDAVDEVETFVEDPEPEPEPEPVASIAVNTTTASYDTPGNDDNIFKLDIIPAPVRGIKGERWYREQPSTDYALQLISASEISNVLTVLEGLEDFHDEMSGYVKYTPSGRPRYVLFFGLYPDRETARRAATSSVPDKLKAIKPYARSVGNILKEIEEIGYWPR